MVQQTEKQVNSVQNADNHKEQPNGENKNAGHSREPLSAAEKIKHVFMFMGMMMSFAMGTYWIAVPKKKKVE